MVILLQLAVSAGALWLAMVATTGFRALETPSDLSLAWLAAAAGLHLLILGAVTLRWRVICATAGPEWSPSLMWMLRVNWIGIGIGQIALGTLSGDAYRAVALQERVVGWEVSIRTVLADRVLGLMGLAVIAVTALAWALGPGLWLLGAAFGAVAFALAWVFWRGLLRSGFAPRMVAQIGEFAETIRLLFSGGAGWIGLLLTIAGHLLNVGVFYAVSRAFGLLPPLTETFIAVPGGILGSALPLSLGGWGVRELSVSILYDILGAPFHNAVVASALFGLSHVAMGAPGLLLFLFTARRTVSPKRS